MKTKGRDKCDTDNTNGPSRLPGVFHASFGTQHGTKARSPLPLTKEEVNGGQAPPEGYASSQERDSSPLLSVHGQSSADHTRLLPEEATRAPPGTVSVWEQRTCKSRRIRGCWSHPLAHQPRCGAAEVHGEPLRIQSAVPSPSLLFLCQLASAQTFGSLRDKEQDTVCATGYPFAWVMAGLGMM